MPQSYFKVDNFDCRRAPGYLIRRLHNLVVPIAEDLFADAEITFTQWVILVALRDAIANTSADLARHMNHDTGAITRLVDQLESRDLLTRTRDKADRRVINLSLTAEGRAVAASLTPRLVDMWNGILEDFTRSEISTWIALTQRMLAAVESAPEERAKPVRKLKVAR
ncbi:MAG TPA: MarR family transcriptional regulator [Rhizomicrobium sp.]|nr:MarR family transcriptional regulator [Rhizomicrobium sp.]